MQVNHLGKNSAQVEIRFAISEKKSFREIREKLWKSEINNSRDALLKSRVWKKGNLADLFNIVFNDPLYSRSPPAVRVHTGLS